MFRVGAFVLIVLMLSLLLGCSDKTSEASPTGVEIAFANCISFLGIVFIDDAWVGTFSSERPVFIEVASGSHSLYVYANNCVTPSDAPDSSFCWTQNFSVSDNTTTNILLDCEGHGCPCRD